MTFDLVSWTQAWAGQNGLKVWSTAETASTNTIAKNDEDAKTKPILRDRASAIGGPSLYLTHRQTLGRGRGDHTWNSPPEGSLLSSWSFAVSKVPQPIFSALAGLALFEACAEIWPNVSFNLKAPNDLFIGDKKTAGILIETVDQGNEKRAVIGLGLNVLTKPNNLDLATCLNDHLSEMPDVKTWNRFMDSILSRFRSALLKGLDPTLAPDDRESLCDALNKHPLLKEPILRVDEFGQLQSRSKTISWQEL